MAETYPLTDLTSFQINALACVARLDDPHGLAVKEALEDEYISEIHHGRLYPNLDELVEKGLIKKGKKDRRTNSYAITQRGKRELNTYIEWLDQSVAEKQPA